MDTKEKIAVLQASENGSVIEFREVNGVREHCPWRDMMEGYWDFVDFEYRIKEKPKTVTLYYYRATKVHPQQGKVGLVETYDRELNFSLGNPFGMKLIKTETIEVNQ